jgi:hypothetical protein
LRSLHFKRPSLHALIALTVTAPLLAGCGSSGSSVSRQPDPASAVPSSAPLYASIVIQPTGSLQSDIQTVAEKLTHTKDPFQRLLEENKEGSHPLKWSEVQPWAGERVGVFLSSLGTGKDSLTGLLEAGSSGALSGQGASGALKSVETQGAALFDVKDAAKARVFLHAQAARNGAVHNSSFQGISYQVDSKGDAAGIVGSYAVIGTEQAFKSVIETVKGASALQNSESYRRLSAKASPGAIAELYISPTGLLGSVGATHEKHNEQQLGYLRQLLTGKGPVFLTVIPTKSSITVDALSTTSGSEASDQAAAAQIFSKLPSDSWFAVGIGNLGHSLQTSVKSLEHLASLGSTSGLGETIPSLHLHGASLNREFLSWMGSAGIFASGTNLLNITAAVVIDSTNPARSRAAVSKLASLLRGDGASITPISLPGAEAAVTVKLKGSLLSIDVADGQGKFVIGLGEASVQAAFQSSSPLAGSPAYTTAQSTLGPEMKPDLLLDFPTIIGVLESLNVQESTTFGKTFTYLRSLGTLTAGSAESGGLTRWRIVLGVQ